MGFLQRFGYLEGQSTNNSEALLREEAVIDAVRTMQRFGGLSPTGSIDNDTLLVIQIWILLYYHFLYKFGAVEQLLATPRCGNKDVELDNEQGRRRRKRFVVGAPGWNKRKITYL